MRVSKISAISPDIWRVNLILIWLDFTWFYNVSEFTSLHDLGWFAVKHTPNPVRLSDLSFSKGWNAPRFNDNQRRVLPHKGAFHGVPDHVPYSEYGFSWCFHQSFDLCNIASLPSALRIRQGWIRPLPDLEDPFPVVSTTDSDQAPSIAKGWYFTSERNLAT